MRVFSRISTRVAGAAMIAAVVGCGQDLGVGPDAASSDAAPPPALHRSGSKAAWLDKEQATFVLNPNVGGTFRVGRDHWITFEPDAVCDPRVSSYGPSEWDKPCVLLRRKITITTQSTFDASGHPYVRFEPELRFAPARTVTLWLYDRDTELNSSYKILYCSWRDDSGNDDFAAGDSDNSGSGSSGSGSSGSGSYGNGDNSCVDESLTDPSLATHLDMKGHRLYRRIKHFSYYVAAE